MTDQGTPAGEEVIIALGSNLEPRHEHLRAGLAALGDVVTLERASSIVETPPLGAAGGGAGQGPYLNLVVRGRTSLEPAALLEALLDIERARGRSRKTPAAPRTLDLDLVFHGDRVIREPSLHVPHPRWAGRSFVVVPLLEIAADRIDPESGRTLREAARPDRFEGWIRSWAPPPEIPAPAPGGEPAGAREHV